MQMQFLDDRSGGGFRQLKEMFGGFSEKEGGPHRLRSPRGQRKEDFSLPAPSKRQPAGDLASGGLPTPQQISIVLGEKAEVMSERAEVTGEAKGLEMPPGEGKGEADTWLWKLDEA